jgi:hypothetical protein
MLQRILNAIGDWNPQLLREWQGRFKPWDVTGAFAVSAIVQFIFMTQRRGPLPQSYTTNHIYCTGANISHPEAIAPAASAGASSKPPIHHDPLCLKDQAGDIIVNWQLWWHDNFTPLTQFLLGAVIVAGVYWVISDFIFEERRGTLNFVRLSPRSGKEILWGKLLGVPTLVYVALVAAIPLHLYAAVQGQIPGSVLIGTYIVGSASCLFFLSGALLWSVTTSALGYLQPWAGAGFVATTLWALAEMPDPTAYRDPLNWLLPFNPSIVTKHLIKASYPNQFTMSWFGLSCNATPWITMLFTTAYLSVWTYWIWQALRRRFQNARGTVLSKKQSYIFTACLIGSLVGFAGDDYSSTALNMSLVICLVMVTLITPNRQTLYEWARYRHQMPKKTLISELLWGEKSPALLAVAVNMAIALALLFPSSLMTATTYMNGVMQLVALAIVVLMLAALFQIMLLIKAPRPELWAVGSWIGCWLLPPMMMALLGFSAPVWAVSIAPWLAVNNTPMVLVLGTLMTQLSIFGLLTNRLTRQLDRAGASESKALLS